MAKKKVLEKKSAASSAKVYVKKTDLIGDIVSNFPETIPVLAAGGLHCIGCHVSVSESLEDGCVAHGVPEKDINEMVNLANKRIFEVENAPNVSFTKNAVLELTKKLKSDGSRYVRIISTFGGEFDFETAQVKEADDVVIHAKDGKGFIEVLIPSRIERMLRSVEIDYDSALKDFTARRK